MTKNKGGRPPKWNSPEELQKKIVKYFRECEEKDRMPSKAGLALHLDTTHETLRAYKEKGGLFTEAIKEAYQHIEEAWIQQLKGSNATGPIFYLKAAFHYKDRMDVTSGDKEIFQPTDEEKKKAEEALKSL